MQGCSLGMGFPPAGVCVQTGYPCARWPSPVKTVRAPTSGCMWCVCVVRLLAPPEFVVSGPLRASGNIRCPPRWRQVFIVSSLELGTWHPFLLHGSFFPKRPLAQLLEVTWDSPVVRICSFSCAWNQQQYLDLLYQPVALHPFNSLFMQKNMCKAKLQTTLLRIFAQ